MEAQKIQRPEPTPKHTVLVEDNELVRKLWEEHYRNNGWSLEVFENPLDLLNQIERYTGREEKLYFYFDQDFGSVRGVGLQLARAVRGRNPHQTVSLVTNHSAAFFGDELRDGLVDYVFGKYPEVLFGTGFSDAKLAGRLDLIDLMLPPFGERCALEKALNSNGYDLEFTLEEHFPSLAPPKPAPVSDVPSPDKSKDVGRPKTFWQRIRRSLGEIFISPETPPRSDRFPVVSHHDAFEKYWRYRAGFSGGAEWN